MVQVIKSHNPYFNRWFSAIKYYACIDGVEIVTILILIDGFLQSITRAEKNELYNMSQSLF